MILIRKDVYPYEFINGKNLMKLHNWKKKKLIVT